MQKPMNSLMVLLLGLLWATPTLEASPSTRRDRRIHARHELVRLSLSPLSAQHVSALRLAFKPRQAVRPLSYTERRRLQRLEVADTKSASLSTNERQQLETLQQRNRQLPPVFRERQRL